MSDFNIHQGTSPLDAAVGNIVRSGLVYGAGMAGGAATEWGGDSGLFPQLGLQIVICRRRPRLAMPLFMAFLVRYRTFTPTMIQQRWRLMGDDRYTLLSWLARHAGA